MRISPISNAQFKAMAVFLAIFPRKIISLTKQCVSSACDRVFLSPKFAHFCSILWYDNYRMFFVYYLVVEYFAWIILFSIVWMVKVQHLLSPAYLATARPVLFTQKLHFAFNSATQSVSTYP